MGRCLYEESVQGVQSGSILERMRMSGGYIRRGKCIVYEEKISVEARPKEDLVSMVGWLE